MERYEIEALREHLTDYVNDHLTRSREPGKYNCPCPDCNSGTKNHGTGAFGIIPGGTKWHCFSCQNKGDLFDLIGIVEGITDYKDQIARANELYGMGTQVQEKKIRRKKRQDAGRPADPGQDYTAYYKKCAGQLPGAGMEYLKSRGISEDTARRYNLGYDPAYNSQGIKTALIIPVNKGRYIARKVEGAETAHKYDNSPGAKTGNVFNLSALQTAKTPVFIVEGALDALSIIEAGGEAVPLEGVEISALDLDRNKPTQPLILALDNDTAGRTATERAETILKSKNIKYFVYDLYSGRKDANELLQQDGELLRRNVAEGIRLPEAEANAEKEKYLQASSLNHLQAFINSIAESANTEYTPTGFKQLDNVLGGGLYEGLYFVGALPSLGKTTLVTQIADNIAEQGRDVIVFSLEMARTELMAKSISRLTLVDVQERKGNPAFAKTDRGITTGSRYQNYSNEEKELIQRAIKKYSQYAGHVFIHEGVGDIGAEQIRETIKQHITFTGNTPVVIVDYLQILAPYNDRASDKQNTDKAVLELKRISRDYKLPIIGVSSLNRENYRQKITMQAFKESGAIEYGCDVLIGLQLKGAGDPAFDVEKEMQKTPREVEALVLKNRHGKRGDVIQFHYYSMFNYFREAGQGSQKRG